MRVIENPGHGLHVPPLEVEEGAITPPFEVPGRYEAIRRALVARGGFTFETASPIAEADLTTLHDAAYIEYLREASREPAGIGIPSVFPYGVQTSPRSPRMKRGTYCFDTYTPIVTGTYEAAVNGAAAAIHGANLLADGADSALYILTRPPGHHAERARCGGYSYFNNAALAADRLAKLGPVAVLDLDVHHGNGTQHLFYDRPDVLVVSIHGDPVHLYPFFSGFADETGTSRGLGSNLNLPLPAASGDLEYEPAVGAALEAITRFRPAFLVVSLGLDAHESDPIGGMKLTNESFAKFGAALKSLSLPTLVVQEGGYNLSAIGTCTVEFLNGLG